MRVNRFQDDRGLTLVELLVVIAILGLVGSVTLTGLVQGMQTSRETDERLEALTDLQRASERMAQDLRRGVWTDTSANPVPAEPPGCTFVSLDPDTLTLIVFDDTDRFRHRYVHAADAITVDIDRWDGTAWVDAGERPLIDGLANAAEGRPVFTYRDADGTDLLADGLDGADRARVRKFTLTLVAALTEAPPVEMSTLVTARNGGLPCPVA